MTDTRRVALTVNGRREERVVDTRMTLVDLMRHELELTGTHVGCEHGVCGACTVIVNGAVTWQHGAHSGARAGQVIVRRDAQPA